MHKWEALAVITVWEVRGVRQNSRHRATAVSMVTASKERPSSSALPARFIDAPSRLGSRVAGVPEVGPLSLDSGRGGPLSHAQACVLVGLEETPELQVVVAGQALKPASEVTPQHGHAADQHRVSR